MYLCLKVKRYVDIVRIRGTARGEALNFPHFQILKLTGRLNSDFRFVNLSLSLFLKLSIVLILLHDFSI